MVTRSKVAFLVLLAAAIAIVVWRPWDWRPDELRDAAREASRVPGVVALDMEQRDSPEPPATTFGPEPSVVHVTTRLDGSLAPEEAATAAESVHALFVPAAEAVADDAMSVLLRVTAGEPDDADGPHPLELWYAAASGADDVADAFTIWQAGARTVGVFGAGQPVADAASAEPGPDGEHETAGVGIEAADAADVVRLAQLAAELGRPANLNVPDAGIGYDGYGSVPDVGAVGLTVAAGSRPGVESVVFADSLEPRLSIRTAWPAESPETRELEQWLEAHDYATTVGHPVAFTISEPGYATLTEGWVSAFPPPEPEPHALPLPEGVDAWPDDPSAPSCTGTDLEIHYGGSSAATGSRYAALLARNVSDRPCAVEELPEVVFHNGDGTPQGDVLLEPYEPGVIPARLVVPPGEQMLAPMRWGAMSTANDPDTTTAIEVTPVPGAEPVLLDVTEHDGSASGLDILDGAQVRVGPWVQALEGWS